MIKRTDETMFATAFRHNHFNGEAAFEKMQRAFGESMDSHRNLLHQSYHRFADRLTLIRIVGNKLADHITRPFSHLRVRETDEERPGFTIDLWDASETKISCPFDSADLEEHVQQSSRHVEFGFISASLDGRYISCQRPRMLTVFDRLTQHVIACVSGTEGLHLYERGKPLHFPLLLWHQDRDMGVIHAGLVSKNNRGALFAGKGGTGKTTASLACLLNGFDFLGDDYIAIQALQDGSYLGHSVYGSTWIMDHHLTLLPLLTPHLIEAERPESEKSLVHLFGVFPEHLARMTPIQVIMLPRLVGGSVCRVRPASKGDALFALAPSSIIILPSSGTQSLSKLAQLVERVPSYWLEFGSSLEYIPSCVEELLEETGRS